MMDNLSGPAAKVNTGLDETVDKLKELEQGYVNLAKTGTGTMLIGKEIAEAAVAPVAATFDTRRALGELSSVGIENLQALEDAAVHFSNEWSRTSKSDFITAAYDIKSGISGLSDHAVGEFTAMAGITAKGTKSTTAEMTKLFAIGYGIYKDYYNDMSDVDFGSMFSAAIGDTVQRYLSDGTKVSASIQTLGKAATNANVPLEEQMTILGMLGQSMSGSEAGTKYRAFLKSAAKAGDKLGLSFIDANNQLRSMPEILMELRGKYGETIDAVEKMEMQKAFGTEEAVAAIDLLYGKTGMLQDNILSLYGSMGQGIEIPTTMAQPINTAEGERWETMKQKMHNVTEQIGNGLLPSFNSLLDKGGQVTDTLSIWIGDHERLVTGIMLLIAVFGGLMMTLGAFQLLVGTSGVILFKTFGTLKTFGMMGKDAFDTVRIASMYAGDGIKFLGGKLVAGGGILKGYAISLGGLAKQAVITGGQILSSLVTSVWSFTTALLANPITWYVIGVMLLIGALYLLWKHWDTVTAFVSGVFNSAMNGAASAMVWVKEKIDAMPEGFINLLAVIFPFIGIPLKIIKNWGSITTFFKDMWNGVKTGYNDFTKEFIPNVLKSGQKIMTTLGEGIKQKLSVPVDAVKGGLAKIRKMLPFSDAKEGPLSTLTLSGKRVFETITTGMNLTKHLPAQVTDEAFSAMDTEAKEHGFSVPDRKAKSIAIKEIFTDSSKEKTETVSDNAPVEEHYHIKLDVDLNDIEEIPKLIRLVKEIQEYNNSKRKPKEPKPI
jgi:TP901 family phage tail tape measure protein